jgi:two-component system, OmpR family, response regulator
MPQDDPARIVVVDDEPDVRAIIAECLGKDGHSVVGCAGGEELDVYLASGSADLLVLDVSMPGESGVSIARRLRAEGAMPIIMLTALDDVIDRVVGLEVGADDYLTKPFDLRELRARVRAVLRRKIAPAKLQPERPTHEEGKNLACFGKVSLDLDRQCLLDCDGAEQRLTSTEFNLLVSFAQNPNRVMSRDRLMENALCDDPEAHRAIDIRVTRIRKKVEVNPAKPCIIKTVRSVGYVYVPPR